MVLGFLLPNRLTEYAPDESKIGLGVRSPSGFVGMNSYL